jgi:hypothetical protein
MATFIWLRREIKSINKIRMRLTDMAAQKRCCTVESTGKLMGRTLMVTHKRRAVMVGFKRVYTRRRMLLSNRNQCRKLQNLPLRNLWQFSNL